MWRSTLLCLALCSAGQVRSEGVATQSLLDIERSVKEFVMARQAAGEGLQVEVKSLDSRLRLSSCDVPLEASWSPGSRSIGRVTVQVKCATPKPWRVHVQSTVTLEGHVWTLARGVQRGELLQRAHLVQKSVKLGTGNAAVTSSGDPVIDIEPWLGYSFTQRVGPGKVLSERMLRPASLVKKGEAVLIRHESVGLSLQTKGVSLDEASRGGRVKVRNTASGKVIDATVISKGVVAVLN